jgi:excisionase family DNA binding protein
MSQPDDLLSVSAAADLLGVHAVTIRRWTDEGKLPEVRTPGGHRRIPREAIERLRREAAPPAPDLPAVGGLADQAWAEHALVHTRYEVRSHPETPWTRDLAPDARAQYRDSGNRLMGLLLQHVAGGGDEEGRRQEIRKLAHGYAREMRDRGLSQSEALRATLFFRDALTESTAYYPHLHAQPAADQVLLIRKVNAFMNEVQLAIAEAYEESE